MGVKVEVAEGREEDTYGIRKGRDGKWRDAGKG